MDADRWIWWKGQWRFVFCFRNLSRYLFTMIWSFVICVECCRRVQISWVYFAARLQSWILSFCFEGSELGIIGRLFSIPFPLVYPRTRPSKTSSCRWKCTSSSTRQKVFAIWDKQNAIQHLLDRLCTLFFYLVLLSQLWDISCSLAQVLSHILYRSGGLHFIGRDSGILEKIGKDWKGLERISCFRPSGSSW